MKHIMGVDIGGTFTDTVVMDETGVVHMFKTPSTPQDNAISVFDSIDLACRATGLDPAKFLQQIDPFFHGTTVCTNTVLTRTGSKVGVITTRGFRHTLPMMRSKRTYSQDALRMDMPSFRDETTLAPVFLIEEVWERIDVNGKEITPLDEVDLARAVQSLISQKVEAIAVCLLWSIRNPDHELKIKQFITENFPEVFVSISSEVMPVIREYERSVVTLVNAYVAKVIQRYLSRLERALREKGLQSAFLMMQSTGGALSSAEALERPCQLFLSGPAGGVNGSLFLGKQLGNKNILTMDMGGTSCDISVIVDGRPKVITRSRIAEYDAALPKLDIETIGAGGGSIAWIDHGVLLRVGPQSSGAEPGPACYNRGGTDATVTDANLVLGYIDPDYFLDGRMPLRLDFAQTAVKRLGEKLGLDMVETAVGIIEVANSSMVNAIRAITVERGHDPRDFVMMCFGGAGPLHTAALMEELGIPIAIIPYTATVHSAYGFVCSDICHHLVASHYIRHPDDPYHFNRIFLDLEEKGRKLLKREGVSESNMKFKRYVDLRYCGQVFEITIDVPTKTLEKRDIGVIMSSFSTMYDSLYGEGTGWKEAGIELINVRLDAIGEMAKPRHLKYPLEGGDPKVALRGTRLCYFPREKDFVPTPDYDGDALRSGMKIPGPAVISMHSTSTVIRPGQEAYVDEYRDIVMRSL